MIVNTKQKLNHLFAVLALAVFGFVLSAGSASATITGAFTSRVFDVGANQNFGKIVWTATTPGNSSVTMQVRSGNLNPPTDGTWTSVSNGGSLYGFNGKQYIQYKATLNSTSDNTQTPTLSDVTIYYESTWNNTVVNAADVKLGEASCGFFNIQDIDGNTYNTVSIGTQCWLKQNLKVTKNPAGSAITRYCYNDNTNNCVTDGGLYTWDTMMNGATSCNGTGASQPACATPVQGICPNGWHIPSHYEWTLLEKSVGSNPGAFPYDESTASYLGTNEGTNLGTGGSSGFEGILAGWRNPGGTFTARDAATRFWSSLGSGSNAWVRGLDSGAPGAVYRSGNGKTAGYSVRCLEGASYTAPYVPSGTFTSQIIDTGQKNASWGNAAWTADNDVPVGTTTMTVKVRSCNDAACSGETAFTSIADTEKFSMTGDAGSSALSDLDSMIVGDRYVQYQVTMTSDGTATPTFADLTINHNSYTTTPQTLTSSSYDTGDDGVLINQISWGETTSAGTNVKFQVRTAPNSGTAPDWTSSKWCGPTTCAATAFVTDYAADWYETTSAGESINSVQRDSANDRWAQYKVWLTTSDASVTPILSSVGLQYVSNSSPKFCKAALVGNPADCPNGETASIAAIQNSTGVNIGKIAITSDYPIAGSSSYPIADNEEGTGSGKDLDGLASIQYFYDAGAILTNGPLGTDAITLTVSDPNNILPTTAGGGGTIMIDNDLDTANEKIEVISYTTKTGTTSANLSGLTRQTWPPETGDAGYTTQKTTHTNSSKIWLWAPSATVKGEVSGVSGNPKTISTSSLTLTPASDFASPVFINNTVKLRIAVNDGNAANQIGKIDSEIFSIDTKVPAYTSYAARIDSNATPVVTNNISATAGQTAAYMRFSNSNITALTCADTSTAWEAYAGTKSWTLSPDANGVSTVYWQFKDNYCNMISGSTVNPPTPINMQITDISTPINSKYRNVIWWNVVSNASAYNVWRCTLSQAEAVSDPAKCDSHANYGGSPFVTITTVNGATNYCFDEGDNNCAEDGAGALTSTTKYFYKVTAEKSDGVSLYSATKSAVPDGSTIGEAPSTDVNPPSLTVVPAATGTTQTATTIGWTTDEASYSLVKYGTSSSNLNLIAGNATESVLTHSVALSNLSSGTLYYYQILSADQTGNLLKSPTDPPTGLYTFTTLSDSIAPSIVGTPSVIAGQTSATISWTTDEVSTSQVKYIEAVDNATDPAGGTATAVQSELVTSHIVIITGLTADTVYNYQVISADASSNPMTYQSASPFSQFNTATTADITPPALDVAPTDTGTTQTTTTIGWTTSEASYSVVKYGTSQNNLNLTAGTVTDSVTVHSVSISGLSAGTLYYYQIFSADSSGNLLKSPVTPPTGLYTFTTASDSTLPGLVGTPAVTPGRDSATISWVTNEASTTRLKYVVAVDNTTAPATFTALQSELVTNHFVILTGLTSSTTYNYQIISADASANTLTSPSASPYLQFSTEFDKADPTPPVITFTEATQGPAVSNTHVEGVNPAVPNLSENTASATFSANENAFFSIVYQAEASANPPASYSKETGYPSLVTTPDTYTVTMTGLLSNTKYYYKLQARDLYGNVGESGPYFFTTLTDIIDPTVSSGPAISFTSTTASITWTASEQIYSKVEYSSTTDPDCTTATYSSATALTTNYNKDQTAALTSLTPSTKYCYRLYMIDSASRPATNDNSGAGYIFTTLPEIPIIASVSLVDATSTTANITWTTVNAKSSSLIDFGTDLRYGTTQGNSSYLVNSHDITLVGLTPGTLYKYRVKSVDAFGNTVIDDNSGQGYIFTADFLAASGAIPGIGSISEESITSTSAVIRWTTSLASDSLVSYGLVAGNFKYETGSSGLSTSHAVALAGLSPSTTYYYQIKSRTAANQPEISDNNYEFTTEAGTEKIPPVLSGIGPVAVTANTATITWTTDEPASSYVDFGTVSSGLYNLSQGTPSISADNNHTVQLKGLTADTYNFRVRSADASGNSATLNGSSSFTITTSSDTVCEVTPCRSCQIQETLSCPVVDLIAPAIADIKVSAIAFNTATITWTTDENSNSMVGYDIYSYDIKGKYTYSSGNSKDSAKSHSVTLNNLDSANTYYFRVLSTDAKGNTAESTDQSFKTPAISESKDKGAATADTLKKEFESIAKTLVKDNLATEENVKELLSRIVNPPVIGAEGPVVKDVKPYGATIVWQTDRKANSVVKFTVEDKINSSAKLINWQEIGMTNIFDTTHQVSLLGLAPSTAYSFQAQSQDILGNIAESEIKTFTTSGASSIFNVTVADLNLTSAKITWETANISTSSVEYGPTASYGNYQENKDEKVLNHSISLANLAPNSVFHFRVRSTEESGTILTSDDYSFSTPSLPEITKYTLGEVKDNSIALSWTSNIPIDTNVRYTDIETNEVKNIGKEEKVIDHVLTITDLEAGKTYKIEIQGRDDAGNLATVPSFDVQTGMDTIAPVISQVRSQSAVLSASDENVQSIISWKTNELSSTKIFWDLGGTRGDILANESVLDANFTTNHIVVLTQFKPGTVYRFRVVSADKFGNTAVSTDYTVLAPVKRKSIIQIIINQFESIFGWTKGLGL